VHALLPPGGHGIGAAARRPQLQGRSVRPCVAASPRWLGNVAQRSHLRGGGRLMAGWRHPDPFKSSQTRTAPGATGAVQNQRRSGMRSTPAGEGQITDGTPVGEIIARREVERHIDAAESMDNGHRLAMCMERELLRIADAPGTFVPDEDPEIDWALVGVVAAKVAEWRDEMAARLHHLDKHAPRRVYVEAMALVARHDEFLEAVREGLREVRS